MDYSIGLRKLRGRRRLMAGLILIYVPAIWLSLELTGSDRATAVVFGIWVVFLFFAVLLVATGRCPRCNNAFHLNGFIPLYLRRCLHCGLHIKADKKPIEHRQPFAGQ
ncbi:MAG TPA: hypothetical protein VD811_01540 [Desulfuromonadales bacterium]|nr:hypothetical protein [Desulfuromonadales bacterium]